MISTEHSGFYFNEQLLVFLFLGEGEKVGERGI